MEYNLAGWGWDGMLVIADGENDGPDRMGWKDGIIFHSIPIPSGILEISHTNVQ